MSLMEEYKKSLKDIEAEEILDIYFFRPLGFVIVKLFYRFPITPNQYSLLALISGLLSAVSFYQGTESGFRLGGFFFLMFAVLDCCDGMVARLKKNGTEFGRIIDGLVDYTVNFAVYIGLALGVRDQAPIMGMSPWILVIIAGLSKTLHSVTFDHYLTEYVSYSKGGTNFTSGELASLELRINNTKLNNQYVKTLALQIYFAYTSLQLKYEKKSLPYEAKNYCLNNLKALRLWGVIGPTTHLVFLIFAFLLYIPNMYFYYSIIFGNIWLALMFLYQNNINNQLELAKV